jgi:hypothetical protein
LDGEVVKIKVDRDRQSQIFHLKVRLRFTNTVEKPLTLLLRAYGEKKDWWVLTNSLSRSLKDAVNGNSVYVDNIGPANSKSLPGWKELRRRLSSGQPPSTVTQTISAARDIFQGYRNGGRDS